MADVRSGPETASACGVVAGLGALLSRLTVRPRRLLLDTPGVETTVPMLRGVWGAALHGLDADVWQIVFEGIRDGAMRTPGYVLRPAPQDPEIAPAVEWISFGPGLAHDAILQRAWDVASGMGLGPDRRRFYIRTMVRLNPNHDSIQNQDTDSDWTLDHAAIPSPFVADEPCEVVFDVPLRLIRGGRLVTEPALPDIVLGGLRRLRALLPRDAQADLHRWWNPVLQAAGRISARPWRGRRLDLIRWSARQQTELELRGVAGAIELPAGAGPLLPLLAALQWIHIGKSTVVGLGQLRIRSQGIRAD